MLLCALVWSLWPSWLLSLAFPDTLISASWLTRTTETRALMSRSSTFLLRYRLASRQITRGRAPLLPLTCSGCLSVSRSVEAGCILQDSGSISLTFYVALLKQGLLCWHTLAIWNQFYMVLLIVMFTLLFVSFPCLVLKQFKPGRFYLYCNSIFFIISFFSPFLFKHNFLLIHTCKQMVEVCISFDDECVSESSILRKTNY